MLKLNLTRWLFALHHDFFFFAATGLYFRVGNKYEDLWIEHRQQWVNLRQKAIVRDLLQFSIHPALRYSSFPHCSQEWGDRPLGSFEEGDNYRHGTGYQDSTTKNS